MAAGEVEALAVDGLRWLIGTGRETEDGGLGWPVTPRCSGCCGT